MDVSFTPDGDWFVFGPTGKTIERGFRSKRAAVEWIRLNT